MRARLAFPAALPVASAAAALCLSATPARAMDFAYLSVAVAANNLQLSEWVREEVFQAEIYPEIVGGEGSRTTGTATRSRAAENPAMRKLVGDSADATRYPVVAEASRNVGTEFLDRLRKSDPKAARAIAEEMQRHDFGQVYAEIIAPFGLRRGDFADAVTAYTMLAWIISNEGTDPTRAQVEAVRRQVASEMITTPEFSNPSVRQRLGEELALLFVIMHASWQSAQRDQQLETYSDRVNAMFSRQFGRNLRQLTLTPQGFRSRG